MLLCHKVVYVYLFIQNLEKVLKIYEKVLQIWKDYILDIYIGLYKGTLEERMELRQDVVQKVHTNQFSCLT